jgi:hypothetical protein
MPMATTSHASPEHPEASGVHDSINLQQRLRKRRLAMSFASYTVTFTVVVFFYFQQMIALRVVGHFALFSLMVNAVLWLLIHTDINLRFRDPSMTAWQMIFSQ